jgi:tetratricopeptide (TPR) repeat protein
MSLASLFIIQLLTGCVFFQKQQDLSPEGNPERERFLRGQALAMTGEFEQALPFLNASIQKKSPDHDEALLLLARCYDQLSQPEKAILTLLELLDRPINPILEIKGKTLLAKNQAKTNIDIQASSHFKSLRNLINLAGDDKVLVLENLRWSMDFSCDQYCLGEVRFLKEIQSEFLYIMETDERAGARAAGVLIEKYQFLAGFLDKEIFESTFKKQLNWALIDSLDKFISMKPQSLVVAAAEATATVTQDEPAAEENEIPPVTFVYAELMKIQKGLVARYDSIESTK